MQKSYSNREVYYITDEKFKFALYKYHKDKHIIFLSLVFVEEPYRRQGIGNEILNEAEFLAKMYDSDIIMLQCKRQSWMRKWYMRHGYVFHSKNKEYDWLKKSIQY
jgi:GNAT superfamily N-acetyltransferase